MIDFMIAMLTPVLHDKTPGAEALAKFLKRKRRPRTRVKLGSCEGRKRSVGNFQFQIILKVPFGQRVMTHVFVAPRTISHRKGEQRMGTCTSIPTSC